MRVVVTGLGLLTPLGAGVGKNFAKIVAGESGIIHTSQIPGLSSAEIELYRQIPSKAIGVCADFEDSGERRLAKFAKYAMAAAEEALDDANLQNCSELDKLRTGVSIGSCIGSVQDIVENSYNMLTKGYKKTQPLFIPRYLNNMAAGPVSIRHGFKAFTHTVSTACATGTSSIGDAYRFIKDGYADTVVAGASEAAHAVALAGFSRSKSVVCGTNEDVTKLSKPFDKSRNGFVLGEGAGMVILESLDHALARNARIYAEIVGYGVSSDAFHITAPSPNGEGAARAMEQALKMADLGTVEGKRHVGYVNAHATSTKLGDRAENDAITTVFGARAKDLVVTSCKGSIGHLLAAAGAVEAVFTVLSLKNGVIPPTLNCKEPDVGFDFEYAGNGKIEKRLEYAVSNSFGFGGVNASLVFKRFEG